MCIKDVKVLGERIVINFDHQYFYLLSLQDLLNQPTSEFQSQLCTYVERFEIFNDELNHEVIGIDTFKLYDTEMLILTKESKFAQIPHQLEIYNLNYIKLVKVIDLKPDYKSNEMI